MMAIVPVAKQKQGDRKKKMSAFKKPKKANLKQMKTHFPS